MSGADYIHTIQIRSASLSTLLWAVRGHPEAKCDSCKAKGSLSHQMQTCPAHGNTRHGNPSVHFNGIIFNWRGEIAPSTVDILKELRSLSRLSARTDNLQIPQIMHDDLLDLHTHGHKHHIPSLVLSYPNDPAQDYGRAIPRDPLTQPSHGGTRPSWLSHPMYPTFFAPWS